MGPDGARNQEVLAMSSSNLLLFSRWKAGDNIFPELLIFLLFPELNLFL
jgi:hypothetical protein